MNIRNSAATYVCGGKKESKIKKAFQYYIIHTSYITAGKGRASTYLQMREYISYTYPTL